MALEQLRIASRRSQLAMVQTNWVKAELEKAHPGVAISVEAMATQGDKILDVALAKIGDKGLFTKELEAQMLVGRAEIAVHSLKDLPTNLPEGLMLGCITEREDPADALVVNAKNAAYQLDTLPKGSVVACVHHATSIFSPSPERARCRHAWCSPADCCRPHERQRERANISPNTINQSIESGENTDAVTC